tara:strand:- start:593 stop:943 length:351 start_codon:yes stop_codon:yes gene_type:complete
MPRYVQKIREDGSSEFVEIVSQSKGSNSAFHMDSAAVHGDISAFVSPIDGTVISDRKQLREHNKRNGVVAASEFSMGYYEDKAKERARLYTGEKTRAEKQRRGEEINNIINHLERR